MRTVKLISFLFFFSLLVGCAHERVSSLKSENCRSLDSFHNDSEDEEGKVANTFKKMLQAYNKQNLNEINDSLADDVTYIRCDGDKCNDYDKKTNPYPLQQDWDKFAKFKVDLDSVCIGKLVITPKNKAIVVAEYNFQYQHKPGRSENCPSSSSTCASNEKGVPVKMSFIKEGNDWKLQDWGNSLSKPRPTSRRAYGK